jgi:hypothetical protein
MTRWRGWRKAACGVAGARVAGFLPNMQEAADRDAGIRELHEE